MALHLLLLSIVLQLFLYISNYHIPIRSHKKALHALMCHHNNNQIKNVCCLLHVPKVSGIICPMHIPDSAKYLELPLLFKRLITPALSPMGALAPVISFSPKTLKVFWIWVTVTDASWPHSCHLPRVSIFLLSCYRICLICGKHPITVFRKKRGGNLAKFLFSLCYEDDQVKLCTKLWSDKSVM